MDTRTIFLTGITGNLGARMALELLAAGHHVVAVSRSRGGGRLVQKRVLRSLSILAGPDGLPPRAAERLTVLHADFTDARAMGALRLPAPVDETWHFASSLKFMPRDREEIFRTNVDGLRTLLDFHHRHARADAPFHYIGTAYVGGKGDGTVPESRLPADPDRAFNNEYERSKLEAEEIVLDEAAAGRLRGDVMRPSIVVGSLRTGALVNYNGYYLGLEAWMRLSEYMKGIGRAGETVRVWVDSESTLNLIPVDAVVEAMLRLAAAPGENGAVYNLVNQCDVTLAQVFEVLQRYLFIRTELCGSDASGSRKSTYEKLVAYSLTYTAPYLKQKLRFQSDRAAAGAGGALEVPMYPDGLESLHNHFFSRFARERPPVLEAIA